MPGARSFPEDDWRRGPHVLHNPMTALNPHAALRALPKAELHLHLEGTIEPATVVELAASHGVKLTEREALARYSYTDFRGFLDAFKWVTSFLREPADFALITRRMSEKLISQNVVYAEVFVAVGILLYRRQDVDAMFRAISDAGDEARKNGLHLRWIFDATRQFGPDAAMEVARWAARLKDHGVVAFGIGGEELSIPASAFRAVYEDVAAQGLHRHIHAGEVGGPQSVRDAINFLEVERIGHGIGVMHDPALMDSLAASQIPLEVCPSSNLFTGALARQRKNPSARIEDHPLRELYRRGLMISLGSDDPAMFHTSLDAEYDAGLRMGLTLNELVHIAAWGFVAAFLPSEEKAALLRAFHSKREALGL
ncbi:MAG: adenosine deaminase [Acidobacteria bacterium]|nr:adenosine deaminase [Acidobacteriota bacterium]MCL5289335.1 adenosine deaminase [Acidobacteriota bacterium]